MVQEKTHRCRIKSANSIQANKSRKPKENAETMDSNPMGIHESRVALGLLLLYST